VRLPLGIDHLYKLQPRLVDPNLASHGISSVCTLCSLIIRLIVNSANAVTVIT
jgi:hypothetical protein